MTGPDERHGAMTITTSPVTHSVRERLHARIERVVDAGLCSGCGACPLLDETLGMRLGDDGFARPVTVGSSEHDLPSRALADFEASCPGIAVHAGGDTTATRHPTMGPVVAAWEAWAADPVVRHAGSSGGVLTALAAHLLESGTAHRVVGATAAEAEPRRSVSVALTTRDEAIASAGSRYAPVCGAAEAGAGAGAGATIGLPCRVAAMRRLADRDAIDDQILLSFFCAGTPSQHATDALAGRLGGPGTPAALRYRGNGWPGRFTVTGPDGTEASLDYEESWGAHLGRAVHDRCKLCPDGVGESADVSAADLWETDDRGYPAFVDAEGTSALIARTPRGHTLVLAAIAAGAIVARPLRIDRLSVVQPLQVERRTLLAGRLLGARLAGRAVPRYSGFSLVRLAAPRWRAAIRAARGTWRRMRRTS